MHITREYPFFGRRPSRDVYSIEHYSYRIHCDGGNLLLILLLIILRIIMEHRDAIIDSNTCNVFNL